MKARNGAATNWSVAHSMKRSLSLLSHRDRGIYRVMVLAQMTTSFLDLAGVLLLGLVAVMATANS